MKQGHHQIPYRPMPAVSRFGIKSWLFHDESCYTGEELQLHRQLLQIREKSGIHPDILFTDNNWFNPDQAFITINPDSWVLPRLLKPGKSITSMDFHIPLLENTRLKWTILSTMMRNIGDYLIIRNQDLPATLLNQPLNYVLLDLVQILKHLADKDNAEFVEQELKQVVRYLRAIEIEISPMAGSDRLFLADSRRKIETEVLPEIQAWLQTQFFKTRLPQIKNHLQDIAEQRHTLLHFSLTKVRANEHPYLEYFINPPEALQKDTAFPTMTAKACASIKLRQEKALPALEFAPEALRNCPGFKYIEELPNSVIDAYGQALSDIQEILRFQEILDNLIQVIDKTGEIFAIARFREEILLLMQEIEAFIRLSQQAITTIQDTNSILYHQTIHQKKELRTYEKLLTNKESQLDEFIKNQDNLARFPVNPAELTKKEQTLMLHVNQFMLELKERGNALQQLHMLEETRVAAQQLMESMHHWIDDQCLRQRRSCAPIPLLAMETKLLPEIHQRPPTATFFLPAATGHTAVSDEPAPFFNQSGMASSEIENTPDYSLLLLFPLVLLILKLLYDALQVTSQMPGDPLLFTHWTTEVADKLTLLNNIDDQELAMDREYFNDSWSRLVNNGENNAVEMQALYEDLDYFLRENRQNKYGF